MDAAPDIATTVESWLRHFSAHPAVAPAPTFREIGAPADPATLVPALAALAAEALARGRNLWIVTADDSLLPELSNALDLHLRPLCLVLPGAEYAGGIALRATLSLLKSRLTRIATEAEGPVWAAMRARLQTEDALWRASLAWCARGLDREAPPAAIGNLFPVRIGPWLLAERMHAAVDWVLMVQAEQLPGALRKSWPQAERTLMLASGIIGGATGLAVIDEIARVRAEIEVLAQELAEMELELATLKGELAVFSLRYHHLVAGRIAELDRIQAALAQQRMQEAPDDPALRMDARKAGARARQSQNEHAAYSSREAAEGEAEQAFSPSNDLKKRFRQLAQKIHPDRARDEADRAWRTRLMSEANRAYRAGDLNGIDEVLALWMEGRQGASPATAGLAPPVASARGVAEVARIRQRLNAIAAELDRLYGSKLYELFAAARVAERQGRDLLHEMVQRLDVQIELAKGELGGLAPATES